VSRSLFFPPGNRPWLRQARLVSAPMVPIFSPILKKSPWLGEPNPMPVCFFFFFFFFVGRPSTPRGNCAKPRATNSPRPLFGSEKARDRRKKPAKSSGITTPRLKAAAIFSAAGHFPGRPSRRPPCRRLQRQLLTCSPPRGKIRVK